MNALPSRRAIALAIGALSSIAILTDKTLAQCATCASDPPCPVYLRQATVVAPEPAPPSWIFNQGTYTHDPATGARVAQYEPIPPVEPLEDQRLVTSRYHRSRTNLRGADGSAETYYEVQQWGNGRGGLDAEWERFHDAWKESYLSGGYYNQGGGPYNQGPYGNGGPYGAPGWGGGYGYGGPGYGFPGYGFPGYGPSGYGYGPGNGGPGNGGPGNGGGPGQGGPMQGAPHDHGHQSHDD